MESVKRVVFGVLGALLLVAGIALLVLPGPGTLLVLAGLILLSRAIPALGRFVDPVRRRAMRAAEESVASPWRIAGSVLAGLLLIGAGLAWGLVPRLPFSGWATAGSLIFSGLVLLALLAWSHARLRAARRARPSTPDRT